MDNIDPQLLVAIHIVITELVNFKELRPIISIY
jgi:hypothetical protein